MPTFGIAPNALDNRRRRSYADTPGYYPEPSAPRIQHQVSDYGAPMAPQQGPRPMSPQLMEQYADTTRRIGARDALVQRNQLNNGILQPPPAPTYIMGGARSASPMGAAPRAAAAPASIPAAFRSA